MDIQGAQRIKKMLPATLLIFIRPPSLQELGARIANRGTETEQTIRVRMECVRSELEAAEKYDYIVVNDKPESALAELLDIIGGARAEIPYD